MEREGPCCRRPQRSVPAPPPFSRCLPGRWLLAAANGRPRPVGSPRDTESRRRLQPIVGASLDLANKIKRALMAFAASVKSSPNQRLVALARCLLMCQRFARRSVYVGIAMNARTQSQGACVVAGLAF